MQPGYFLKLILDNNINGILDNNGNLFGPEKRTVTR